MKLIDAKSQLTTDGHHPNLEAVDVAFGGNIDYAMLIKLFGASVGEKDETGYSPAECIGTKTKIISGSPKPFHISTSHIERQDLTMRMSMRRFTRLTNGFSKKIENHAYAIALHYMYYNFCRIHKCLSCTPAMAARVKSRLWEIMDIVALLPEVNAKPRGPYKKKNTA